MRRRDVFLAVLGALSCAGISYGMATSEVGPDSARGYPTAAQPEWPVGLVELPRHESRVRSFWVNGSETFYFRASPEEVNQLILLFSKTRMRDHELAIKERKAQGKSLDAGRFDYNVTLQVVGGISLSGAREAEKPITHEPTLILYIDLPADRALAERITLPGNIIVNNEVAGFPLKGKATKPKRQTWYAQAQFDDSKPAVDFEHGVSTKVTLWEKDVEDGTPVGRVDYKGYFHAAFSEGEIADLKTGRSWLTLTVGNWLTEPKSDDPKVDWKSLSREKEKAKPLTVARPRLYYGRILFEDGSPAASSAWPGREFFLNFPYAGSARPDSDGYFQVCFTGDQYEKAKAGKERRNIYIPDEDDRNKGTALFVFPVSRLSQDKAKAGVVRIPRPAKERDR